MRWPRRVSRLLAQRAAFVFVKLFSSLHLPTQPTEGCVPGKTTGLPLLPSGHYTCLNEQWRTGSRGSPEFCRALLECILTRLLAAAPCGGRCLERQTPLFAEGRREGAAAVTAAASCSGGDGHPETARAAGAWPAPGILAANPGPCSSSVRAGSSGEGQLAKTWGPRSWHSEAAWKMANRYSALFSWGS